MRTLAHFVTLSLVLVAPLTGGCLVPGQVSEQTPMTGPYCVAPSGLSANCGANGALVNFTVATDDGGLDNCNAAPCILGAACLVDVDGVSPEWGTCSATEPAPTDAGPTAPAGGKPGVVAGCCYFEGNSYCTGGFSVIYSTATDAGCSCVIVEDGQNPFWGPGVCE